MDNKSSPKEVRIVLSLNVDDFRKLQSVMKRHTKNLELTRKSNAKKFGKDPSEVKQRTSNIIKIAQFEPLLQGTYFDVSGEVEDRNYNEAQIKSPVLQQEIQAPREDSPKLKTTFFSEFVTPKDQKWSSLMQEDEYLSFLENLRDEPESENETKSEQIQNQGGSVCEYIFKRGIKKGTKCSLPCKTHPNFCNKHK